VKTNPLFGGGSVVLMVKTRDVLVWRVVRDIHQFFSAACKLVYLRDTDEKWVYFDKDLMRRLGVSIESHGKMPDVTVYVEEKNWLILIEAVTSHGPINPKRRGELKTLFKDSQAGLVFVTAFLDRHAMMRYLGEISWETEVWVADSPTHLIHFNGERFLGPHGEN